MRYITVEANGNLCLTEKGTAVAESMYQRHTVLTTLLKKLGVSEEIAAKDACKIEHVISEETFAAITRYIDK